jgi:glycosyltransferase involved in cell wall biosynthesis
VEDLMKLIEAYERGGYDLILGSRYRDKGPHGWSMRLLGTRIFSLIATAFSGVRVTDVTCGLKLLSRDVIPVALNLPTEDMHAELVVGLARAGARIHEVGVEVRPREAGTSMYDFCKGFWYPAKTALCLVGELMFCNEGAFGHRPHRAGARAGSGTRPAGGG